MAGLASALNAKIRSHPVLNYVCSTHFWGPVSNFGIPVAAVIDTQKDPELISGQMTGALLIYSATFMRYSMAVQPANYLLFACHFINEGAQLTQGYRYLNYWNWGGRQAALEQKAREGVDGAKGAADVVTRKGGQVLDKAKEAVGK